MHTPLSSLLRPLFTTAQDVMEPSLRTLDPEGHNLSMVRLTLGAVLDEALHSPPTRDVASIGVGLRSTGITAHDQITLHKRVHEASQTWRDVNQPILDALVAALPILQGPESQADIVWLPYEHEATYHDGTIIRHSCAYVLRINHQTVHDPSTAQHLGLEALLARLDSISRATAHCQPATQHLAITAPSYAKSIGDHVAAATHKEARIFLEDVNPDDWSKSAHKARFRPFAQD